MTNEQAIARPTTRRPALSIVIAPSLAARWLLLASLSLTFFWFGVLKVIGLSPVVPLLKATFPFMATDPYLSLLGAFEVVIAFGLLIGRLRRVTLTLIVLHLLGTLSIVVIAPHVLFAPQFPALTMEGEFVVKNLVLIAASLVLLTHPADA
jgi:putative oxidoreductase